jgi:very-short-patch-repair endonuclease
MLRRQMSPAEAALWALLRRPPLDAWHFRRQVRIGPLHADFGCHAAKLLIEVDGSQHFSDVAQADDRRRDSIFATEGYAVLRVTTAEVLGDPGAVAAAVLARLLT